MVVHFLAGEGLRVFLPKMKSQFNVVLYLSFPLILWRLAGWLSIPSVVVFAPQCHWYFREKLREASKGSCYSDTIKMTSFCSLKFYI